MAQPVFIVGAMGAGKTAVGRELARSLRRDFLDTDLAICERTGVDIGLIFEKEGEQGFRERESKVLEEFAMLQDCIIATGGGIVLDAGNRDCMSAHGTVVYLEVSPEVQLQRARQTPNRPLLDDTDRQQKFNALAEERTPLYEAVADMVVKTDNRHVRDVAREIIAHLENDQESTASESAK